MDRPNASEGDLVARFDSLRRGETPHSLRFCEPIEILRADEPAQVSELLERVRRAASAGLHAAGYLAYEAAAGLGDEMRVHPLPRDAPPLALFALFQERVEVSPPEAAGEEEWRIGPWEASVSRAGHRRAVEDIRERIAAGETYQVNHTLLLRAPFEGSAPALYAELCRSQAAAHCAYLDLGAHVVVSASPELFFRWDGRRLELRPMKGTRRRGRWAEEDAALAAELHDSPKDRAENLMIVDLLRNDAGRVAEWGSVVVTRLFEVESYPTVHQLTSSIEATTRPETGLPDIFRALFPCGSVTGAPKIQTMKVIHGSEGAPRGVYTGAIGYVSEGVAEFSVAIRTVVLDRHRGTAELGVGSGITWDSDPDAEYDECLTKSAFVRPPPRFELLETMLVEDGEVFLLDEHVRRVVRSAELWSFPATDADVRAGILRAAASSGHGGRPQRLRMRLDRHGESRFTSEPLPDEAERAAPLRVAVSAEPVDSRDPLLYHKTTDRRMYDRRRAARTDCDDVILVNERGELTEATLANLVVQQGERLWTPPVSAGLLPGTYRERMIREGRLEERTLRPPELRRADRVYLINSVRKLQEAYLVE